MKKILNTIIEILIIILFIVSALVLGLAIASKSTGIPHIGGYTLFSVQTNSMEPTINVGDLMISDIYSENDEIEVGDVITFETYVDRTKVLISHRVIDIKDVYGAKFYITKGDNALAQDSRELAASDIVAKWTGKKLNGVGSLLDFLQSKKGFFIAVLLPLIIFFLYALYSFVVNLITYNSDKAAEAAKESVQSLIEEQKRQVIEEYLAQQKAKELVDANIETSTKE